MRISKSLFVIPLLAIIPALLSDPGVAQTPVPDFNSGITPFQQYHGGDIDSINMATGSVNLHLPLISFPQKGSGLRLAFAINYNSTTVKRTHVGTGANSYYQWSLVDTNYPSVIVFDDQIYSLYLTEACEPNPPCGHGVQTYYHFYAVTAPDGAQHVMGYTSGSPTQNSGAVSLRSMDMTGLYLTIPDVTKTGGGNYTIYDESGNRYNFSYSVSGNGPWGVYGYPGGWRTDTNGNSITSTSSTYTDTIGRSIPAPPLVESSTNNTDTSGCTGPLAITKAVLWQVPGYNGQSYPIKFCYASTAVNVYDDGAGGQNGGPDGSVWGVTVIQSIVLPDAKTLSFSSGTPTAWEFEYNDQEGNGCSSYNYTGPCQFATLSKVTLPTGGSISYTYQMYGNSNSLQRAVSTRTVSDGTTSNTWTYAYTLPASPSWVGSTVVTAPKLPYDSQANDTVHTVLETWAGHFDTVFVNQIDYYQGSHTSGTLLKSVAKGITFYANPYYQVNVGGQITPGIGSNKAGQLLNSETTTLTNSKVSQTAYGYDNGFSVVGLNGSACCTFYYGLQTQVKSFDYGAGAPGALLRQVNTSYIWQTNSNYLTANLMNKPTTVATLDGSGSQAAQTTNAYDENNGSPQGILGNLTSVTRWLNGGTSPKSQTIFNAVGMPTKTIDPNLNPTTSTYDSTGIFPSQIQHPDTTSNGTVVHHIDSYTYDANAGLMTSHTDQNLLKTSFGYDATHRLTSVAYPDGGSEGYAFNDTPPSPSFTFTKAINTSKTLTKVGVLDGLGRTTQTQLTSDQQGTDYTDTTYDAVGRVASVSNPHRTCGTDITSACGVTTYAYDGLARKLSESYPDGSVLTTAYCGPSTLVTDPTKRWRRSRVDGLGRLVEVDEPNAIGASVASTGCPGTGEPIWVTAYTVNTLGALTNALQNGSHQRTFTYDTLARLLISANPEVGTITYTYDPNGNVLTKKDARAITTTYGYDPLNRELTRTYSNSDPTVTTTYDQPACLTLSACQNIGYRTSMTDAAGSESWAYQVDKTNSRSVHVDQRTTNSLTKTSTYYLDFSGNATQAVYPTGRTIDYTYDAADRPSTAVDGSNGITYATGFQSSPGTGCLANVTCYTPQGSVYAVSIGQTSTFTGLNITNIYNSRLQPQEFKASSTGGSAIDITYSYADPLNSNKNAGHVFSVTNNLNSSRTQNFSYDQLGRIISAGTSSTTGAYCWGYQYSYDAWGNLTSQPGWTPNYSACTQTILPGSPVDANNHVTTFGYDVAGNTTGDTFYAYTWDAESQLKTAGGVTYTDDGDGRRVAKVGSKLYWYGAGSEILAETDASGNTLNEYVFFGGKRIALLSASSTAQYYVEDFLGSSRIVITNTGVVCYDADFGPYGVERPITDSCLQNNYKFEGKERDTETQNDEFGARYYTWRFGRWLSADWSSVPAPVPYANLTNPQTLNLYSMVADDPESFADLDGHENCNICLLLTPAPLGTVQNTLNSVIGIGKRFLGNVYENITGNPRPESLRPSNEEQKAAGETTEKTLSLGITGAGIASAAVGSSPILPDDALVVRGGSANPGGANSPEGIAAGTDTHPSGVTGFSVESAPGKSVQQLVQESPTTSRYGQVGCCTVGQVRNAGGDVIPTTGQSPNHATVTGLKPETASQLLTPTIPNPAKVNQ